MKHIKRIIALSLAMIMLLSIAVYAEEGTTTVKDTTKSVEISVPTTNAYSEFLDRLENASEKTIKVADSSSYFKFKPADKGYVYCKITSDKDNKKKVDVKKCDYNGKKIATIKSDVKPGKTFYALVPVDAGKTYRFKFDGAAAGDQFSIRAALVQAGTKRTLVKVDTDDCAIAAGMKTSKTAYTTYWKVKTASKGAFTVYISDFYNTKDLKSASVTLCNSKKKAVSATASITGKRTSADGITLSRATYGVDKGTYYIKVKTKAPIYGLKVRTDATYNRDNTGKKSKAKTLNEGEIRKTVFFASGRSASHYYKFTLDADKYVNISVDGFISPGNKLKLSLVNSKGKKYGSMEVKGKVNTKNIIDLYNTSKKLPKGTYYVKLSKSSKKTSAVYEINFETSMDKSFKK